MTYSGGILSKDNHQIGYFLVFDGVATKIATHSSIASADTIVGLPSGSGISLDRTRGLIMPGGLTLQVAATDEMKVLFARRGGVQGTLAIPMEYSDTVLELKEGTPYPAGTEVYCEKETILLGPVVAGQYTGCTRAYRESEQQGHAEGSIVSDRPRFWMNRRATLHATDLETGDDAPVRTMILSRSPKFNNGKYELSFTDMQREFNRKIYVGWRAQDAEVIDRVSLPGQEEFKLKVSDISQFSREADSHIKITFDGGRSFALFKIRPVQVNAADKEVTVYFAPDGDLIGYGGNITSAAGVQNWFGERAGGAPPPDAETTVQTVGYVKGAPALVALMLLMSRTGNTLNGGYDLLPGVPISGAVGDGDLSPTRIGAGIPVDWVDMASFERYIEGESIAVIIDTPMTIVEFLENELLWQLGGFCYISPEGKIAFKPFEPAVPQGEPIDIYDENQIVNMTRTIVDDESEVIAAGEIECDWDYATGQFRKTIEVMWPTTYQTYGEGRSQLKFKSRSVQTSDSNVNGSLSSSVVNELQLVTMMDRIYARTKDGVEKISLSIPWKYSEKFKIGYVFKYTDSVLPSSGATGFTAKQFEVTGVDTEFSAGRVRITAEEMPRGWLVAPSCFVDSYNPVNFTVDIDLAGDASLLFDVDPGFDFAQDWEVIIYEAAAVPSFSASGTATIASVTANTITFTGAPTLIPNPGDLIVLDCTQNTGNPNDSAGADVEDHMFNGDSSTYPPAILGGLLEPNRWS